MPISSSPFGSVRLTGEDAAKFIEQVREWQPSDEAKRSVQAGVAMAREFNEKGVIKLKLSRKTQTEHD